MKENKQVNPAVSSCTAEIVQKDGLAKISRSPGIAVHLSLIHISCTVATSLPSREVWPGLLSI